MSEFYAGLATVARNLLTKYGQAVTIKRITGGTYDPVTGATTPGIEMTYKPNGVLKIYADNLIDGTRILKSDRELILDDTIEPLTTDLVTIRGEQWAIQSVEENNPAGTPLTYSVQVRQ